MCILPIEVQRFPTAAFGTLLGIAQNKPYGHGSLFTLYRHESLKAKTPAPCIRGLWRNLVRGIFAMGSAMLVHWLQEKTEPRQVIKCRMPCDFLLMLCADLGGTGPSVPRQEQRATRTACGSSRHSLASVRRQRDNKGRAALCSYDVHIGIRVRPPGRAEHKIARGKIRPRVLFACAPGALSNKENKRNSFKGESGGTRTSNMSQEGSKNPFRLGTKGG